MSFLSRANRSTQRMGAHFRSSNFSRSVGGLPGKAMGKAGKFFFSGGTAGVLAFGATLPIILSPWTHDSRKDNLLDHMAKETVSSGMGIIGQIGAEAAVTGGLGLLGMTGFLPGVAAFAAGWAAQDLAMDVGKDLMKSAGEAYREAKGSARKGIKQNERTVKALQQGLGLLGQGTRGHNFLGKEASFMHN